MFEVIKQTMSNPFKPEIIDSTTIVLKQSKPFVQMSYKYEGDFSKLTDQEAINKVLEDFYKENYKDKLHEGKLTDLELEVARIKEQNKAYEFQSDLVAQSIIELTEVVLASMDQPEEIIEEVEEVVGEIVDNEVGEPDESN